MNLDLMNNVGEAAAQEIELAIREAATIADVYQLLPTVLADIRKAHPTLPWDVIGMAAGRALGRIEGRRAEQTGKSYLDD